MGDTHIDWTQKVWNPVTGCTAEYQCWERCYARGFAQRLAGRAGYPADDPFAVTFHPDKLELPLRWRKKRIVFVDSMGDLFHDQVSDGVLDHVFAVMALAPQHTFQVLTKRAGRMRAYMNDPRTYSYVLAQSEPVYYKDMSRIPPVQSRWPLPNVWLGVSVEDQRAANVRIPLLLATPAAVRIASCEPLLGPVTLRPWWLRPTCTMCDGTMGVPVEGGSKPCPRCFDHQSIDPARLSWVIAGGETGARARPCHPDWLRTLRDQCRAAGTPFWFKQWGEWLPNAQEYGCDPGGVNWERRHVRLSPSGLTIRSGAALEPGEVLMCRAGHKVASDVLDGCRHKETPHALPR